MADYTISPPWAQVNRGNKNLHLPIEPGTFSAASICRMASASEIGFQSCHFAYTQIESSVVGDNGNSYGLVHDEIVPFSAQ